MASRNNYVLSSPGFVVDPESVSLNSGRQIDWANVVDDGTYGTAGSGKRVIPAGTIMAEMASGKIVPRATRPGTETAIGILVASADEDSRSDSLSGYGVYVGGVFFETMLPDAGDAALATYKTELESGAGRFVFETYQDVRS